MVYYRKQENNFNPRDLTLYLSLFILPILFCNLDNVWTRENIYL